MLTLEPRLITSLCWLALLAGGIPRGAFAASFAETLFAGGGAVQAAQPEGIAYGNGSVWVAYGNNAYTRDYSGAATIVRYDLSGAVQSTYSLAGSVGGLKYNPGTGQFWALQGRDAYSQLSIIDPGTGNIASYGFVGPSDYDPGTRAFFDVAFTKSGVFLSETKPFASDFQSEVVVRLNNPTPSGPLGLTTVLNLDSLLARDPRALNSTASGDLILTCSRDQALTFVTDPGQSTQSARSLQLIAAPGDNLGDPSDALSPGASSGVFYLTDAATNAIYRISATGLDPNGIFVTAGDEFGSVDPNTGLVTPIIYGTDLEGMAFVPDAAAAPEPSGAGLILSGLAIGVLGLLSRRSRCGALLD